MKVSVKTPSERKLVAVVGDGGVWIRGPGDDRRIFINKDGVGVPEPFALELVAGVSTLNRTNIYEGGEITLLF